MFEKANFPTIWKHDSPILIWPDLATAHYAIATRELLESENPPFLAKEDNPPNCPELRPIERYWALVKGILRKASLAAKNDADFKRKWKKYSSKVTKEMVQNLMGGHQVES